MQNDPLTLYHTPPTGATTAVTLSGAGSDSYSFPRIGIGPTSATYRYPISTSHWIDLFIGRQVGKRNRYTVSLAESELVADPIDSEKNVTKTTRVYLVADVGPLGVGTNWDKMCHMLANFVYDTTTDPVWLNSILAGEN